MHHVPSWLIVSKIVAVQKLIADVPFIATGVVSLPLALLLLSKRRINAMTSMIMLSSFFSFVAATLDLVILIQASNLDASAAHQPSVTARIIREMFLACAITLRFLFFWHFVALPARGETQTVVTRYPPPESFVPDMTDVHSGSWTQWGIFGIVLKYFLLTAVVAVGVLESIWRLEFQFGFSDSGSTMETASATLEVALSFLFILKLMGNLLFATGRRRVMFLGFLPVLLGMSISAGVSAGNLAVDMFMDYPLGRLLQALELYVLCLYVLFAALDDVGPPGQPTIVQEEEKSRRERRVSAAESFSAVQAPSDDVMVISPNPRSSVRPSMGRRASSTERLATWVSRRLSGRPAEFDPPYANRGSVTREGISRGRTPSTTSFLRGKEKEKEDSESATGTESLYSMYTREDMQRLNGVVDQPVQAPRRSEMFTVPAAAPPVPKLNIGRFAGTARDSGAASPIYGLNGPVQDTRSRSPLKPAPTEGIPAVPAPVAVEPVVVDSSTNTSTETIPSVVTPELGEEPDEKLAAAAAAEATAKLVKAIEEFSAEGLQLPEPRPDAARSMQFSDLSSPRSGGSVFSLTRFPLPPVLPSANPDATDKRNARESATESDIDGEFEFVPPRMQTRQQSFPLSTTRGSDMSSMLPDGATRSSKLALDAYRYPGREITSFIGAVSREDKDMADARAISRILSDPPSPRLPIGPQDSRKRSRMSMAPTKTSQDSNKAPPTPKPTVVIPNSLPANPRPSPRSTTATSPDLSPTSRARLTLSRPPQPSQPRLQEEPDLRVQFVSPRPAPAPAPSA